ncbi:unnamed protein product [Nesidiocoris tenuis]|uniref:Creatinase N-terminal domain-containing protein n=1 Tax=Nesidiocoris tenuis TaxID=355587 RepID=A0A6H5H0A7_9HEMI|nr:unnamed protein product [Nesidiocoris tenuis]
MLGFAWLLAGNASNSTALDSARGQGYGAKLNLCHPTSVDVCLVCAGQSRTGISSSKLSGYPRTACPPSESTPQPPLRVDASDLLARFRQEMARNTARAEKFDAYLLPGSDAHQSPTLAERDKRIKFLTGFSGSKAMAIVTQDKAAIWVDPYDAMQADEEISCVWTIYTDSKNDMKAGDEWDEFTVAATLDEFRRQQASSEGISFKTIVAFGAHSASPHHDTNNITSIKINSSSILLIDSGGQYLGWLAKSAIDVIPTTITTRTLESRRTADTIPMAQPQLQVFDKLMQIPLANLAYNTSAGVYQKVKGCNNFIGCVLDTAEGAAALAISAVAPVANKFQGPIQAVDSTLCMGIDALQDKVPMVKEPPSQVRKVHELLKSV